MRIHASFQVEKCLNILFLIYPMINPKKMRLQRIHKRIFSLWIKFLLLIVNLLF